MVALVREAFLFSMEMTSVSDLRNQVMNAARRATFISVQHSCSSRRYSQKSLRWWAVDRMVFGLRSRSSRNVRYEQMGWIGANSSSSTIQRICSVLGGRTRCTFMIYIPFIKKVIRICISTKNNKVRDSFVVYIVSRSISQSRFRAQLLIQLLLRPECPLLDFCPVMRSFSARPLRCRHLPLPPNTKVGTSNVLIFLDLCKQRKAG